MKAAKAVVIRTGHTNVRVRLGYDMRGWNTHIINARRLRSIDMTPIFTQESLLQVKAWIYSAQCRDGIVYRNARVRKRNKGVVCRRRKTNGLNSSEHVHMDCRKGGPGGRLAVLHSVRKGEWIVNGGSTAN